MDSKNFTNDKHVFWQGYLERFLDRERERMFGWTDDKICRLLHNCVSLHNVSISEVQAFYETYPYPVNYPVTIYVPPKASKDNWNMSETARKRYQETKKKYNQFNKEKMYAKGEEI